MDQQEQNQSQGFMKEQLNKGKEMAKDQVKKAANKKKKQLLIKILLNPITWKILAVVGIVIGGTILITGLIDVIGDATQNETNEAKKGAVSVSMSSPSLGENTNNTAIVIKPTQNNDSYEITTTYDDENIDDIRKELDEKYSNDLSDFNDFDTKVITGLEENGLDLDSYTTEELKCLPQFLKAESCTQFLDLRPNSQKFDSSGKYKPKQMSELGENEVPGIILVQRTNTRDTNPVTLEYKKLEEFNTLVSNNDINVKNYFTINEKGNLVIAKWDNVTVTVNGNFPQEVPTEERVQNRNENIISTTEIPYSQYVEKFTMPFDFLTQLLVITEDPKFCLEVADIVLGSKIVINIQEEETITTDVESRTYDIHSREEKYINYEVAPSIESQTDYFINLTKDDEENECTTYKNEKTDVTITTVYTSHTYSFEITESDTWIAHYKKTYAKQEKQPLPETTSNIDSKGEYEAGEEVIITDSAEILNDNEAKKLKADKETYYKNKIQTPRVTVLDKSSFGKNYKQISITPSGKFKTNLSTLEYEEQKVVNEDETETITYNMPYSFTATTIKTSEVPAEISFTFRLNSNYTYSLLSNTKDSIKCNISKLRIIPYSKINLISTIKTNVTKYPSDPNPVTNTHIYAKDGSGNFEKFLLAYDNNKKAVELMRDVDSWLFEMMEENENTIELVDTIKYLLYIYDGTDYGVTELDLSMFNPIEFTTINGNGTGYWWPVGSDDTEDINGVTYATGEPSSVNITSKYGPRSISASGFHYGIDISGHRNANIIAVKAGVVQKVVDQYGEGGFDQSLANRANYIIIKHDDGTSSAYWHLEKGTTKVSEGDRVEQGQVIAGMGNSGYSSGVHLHFEIRDANGNRLNPEEFVDKNNPRPTLVTGGLSEELYNMLIYFEGGTQHMTETGDYIIFNNGIDKNYELTYGIAVGYQGYGSYFPDLVPNPTIGQVVSKDIYNQIFERVCNEKNNYIDIACAKHNVTLTQNQRDAVFLFVYNMSDGKNAADKAIKAYKDGGNEAYYEYTKSASIQAVQSRRAKEYELFKNGTYIK